MSTEYRHPPRPNEIKFWVFASRWIQAPMYFGLIIAQLVYAFKFAQELIHLIAGSVQMKETEILLAVLGLIDVVMVANLMLMVIVGGYETFVSKLHLNNHPDNPEWLRHVDAGMLKIKLAASLITISSIHMLKTFINAENVPVNIIYSQVLIHCVFLISALALAWTERLLKHHH